MYEIDKHDTVVEIVDVPLQDVGAPMPIVVASDYEVFLSYLPPMEYSWAALIRFVHPRFPIVSGPNDEALNGHPLYKRGLGTCAVYEVHSSSLIRRLERMNSVHPSHDPKKFDILRHFIFTFKDGAFECVAEGFESELIAQEGRVELMASRVRDD